MANIGAYSRHKFLSELLTPLYTEKGDGAVANVYSPAEQQAKVWANLTNDLTDAQLSTVLASIQQAAALPTGAAITTGATTALSYHYKTSPTSGIIKLALTEFAFGTLTDNANVAFGASLISFPTETYVAAKYLAGTITGTGADNRTTAAEIGLGTVIGSGANATLSAVGVAAESIMGGTPTSAFSDGGATSTATVFGPSNTSVNASIAPGIVLRTTTPGLAVFLNGAAAAQDVTANMTMTITGSVILEYVYGP